MLVKNQTGESEQFSESQSNKFQVKLAKAFAFDPTKEPTYHINEQYKFQPKLSGNGVDQGIRIASTCLEV